VTAHRRVTGPAVLAAFRAARAQHGVPASTLTGNGLVFTTRFAGGKGGRNALEAEPSPAQGKAQRFQQTLKNWLRARHVQPATRPPGPQTKTTPNPLRVQGHSYFLRQDICGAEGIRTPDPLHAMELPVIVHCGSWQRNTR